MAERTLPILYVKELFFRAFNRLLLTISQNSHLLFDCKEDDLGGSLNNK
jgi:hypothetical protein